MKEKDLDDELLDDEYGEEDEGWDLESDEDSEDDDYKPPEPKSKRKVISDPLKYENDQLVRAVDELTADILAEKHSNSYRDHFFPALINKMELKLGVEIGVDKGEFSNHILSKTKIQRYFCVDTWQDNFGSDYKPNEYDKDGNKRFLAAQKILQPYINEKRVEMLRMTSLQAVEELNKNSFDGKISLDFCYIDGDHSLVGVYEDLRAWVPRVRIGGIVAGHDWKDGPKSGMNDFFGRQLDYKIKTVTEEYCKKYGYALRNVGGRIVSWYFVKNREPL